VDHNRNTVARETNVKFDTIRPNGKRLTKRRHCIFRRDGRGAAVTYDQEF
jgi:hypothetical protein